jgi:hypothetical protein
MCLKTVDTNSAVHIVRNTGYSINVFFVFDVFYKKTEIEEIF